MPEFGDFSRTATVVRHTNKVMADTKVPAGTSTKGGAVLAFTPLYQENNAVKKFSDSIAKLFDPKTASLTQYANQQGFYVEVEKDPKRISNQRMTLKNLSLEAEMLITDSFKTIRKNLEANKQFSLLQTDYKSAVETIGFAVNILSYEAPGNGDPADTERLRNVQKEAQKLIDQAKSVTSMNQGAKDVFESVLDAKTDLDVLKAINNVLESHELKGIDELYSGVFKSKLKQSFGNGPAGDIFADIIVEKIRVHAQQNYTERLGQMEKRFRSGDTYITDLKQEATKLNENLAKSFRKTSFNNSKDIYEFEFGNDGVTPGTKGEVANAYEAINHNLSRIIELSVADDSFKTEKGQAFRNIIKEFENLSLETDKVEKQYKSLDALHQRIAFVINPNLNKEEGQSVFKNFDLKLFSNSSNEVREAVEKIIELNTGTAPAADFWTNNSSVDLLIHNDLDTIGLTLAQKKEYQNALSTIEVGLVNLKRSANAKGKYLRDGTHKLQVSLEKTLDTLPFARTAFNEAFKVNNFGKKLHSLDKIAFLIMDDYTPKLRDEIDEALAKYTDENKETNKLERTTLAKEILKKEGLAVTSAVVDLFQNDAAWAQLKQDIKNSKPSIFTHIEEDEKLLAKIQDEPYRNELARVMRQIAAVHYLRELSQETSDETKIKDLQTKYIETLGIADEPFMDMKNLDIDDAGIDYNQIIANILFDVEEEATLIKFRDNVISNPRQAIEDMLSSEAGISKQKIRDQKYDGVSNLGSIVSGLDKFINGVVSAFANLISTDSIKEHHEALREPRGRQHFPSRVYGRFEAALVNVSTGRAQADAHGSNYKWY